MKSCSEDDPGWSTKIHQVMLLFVLVLRTGQCSGNHMSRRPNPKGGAEDFPQPKPPADPKKQEPLTPLFRENMKKKENHSPNLVKQQTNLT